MVKMAIAPFFYLATGSSVHPASPGVSPGEAAQFLSVAHAFYQVGISDRGPAAGSEKFAGVVFLANLVGSGQ